MSAAVIGDRVDSLHSGKKHVKIHRGGGGGGSISEGLLSAMYKYSLKSIRSRPNIDTFEIAVGDVAAGVRCIVIQENPIP